MSKITITSKRFRDQKILFEGDYETKKVCVESAVEAGVDLEDAQLWRSWFGPAESATGLRGANLSNGRLKGADFSGVNLSAANLTGADLGEANLSRATLPGADLTQANLHNTNLKEANLEYANLYGPILNELF